MAAGLVNGSLVVFKQGYKVTWPDDKRKISPLISYPYGDEVLPMANGPIDQLAISDGDDQLLIAATSNQQVVMSAYVKEEDFLTESVTIERQEVVLPLGLAKPVRQLLIDPEQHWLYVLSGENQLTVVNIRNIERPQIHETLNLADTRVTTIEFLLGGVSLLVGDDRGNISQWFMVQQGEGCN